MDSGLGGHLAERAPGGPINGLAHKMFSCGDDVSENTPEK